MKRETLTSKQTFIMLCSLDHLVCGFLQIVAQKFDNDGRRNALNVSHVKLTESY